MDLLNMELQSMLIFESTATDGAYHIPVIPHMHLAYMLIQSLRILKSLLAVWTLATLSRIFWISHVIPRKTRATHLFIHKWLHEILGMEVKEDFLFYFTLNLCLDVELRIWHWKGP
jgi:hypothetical protein